MHYFGVAEGGFINARRTDSKTAARPGLPGHRSMAASIALASLFSGWVVSTRRVQHARHWNR